MKKLSGFSYIALLILALVGSGCASVTGSSNQSVSVQARQQSGVEVRGASCELTNDEGKWFVITPGSIMIHRSNKSLDVECKKDGFSPGATSIESSTKAAMWGNIIIGGVVGAVVDHNTGAAYEYPTQIRVVMASLVAMINPDRTASEQSNTRKGKASVTEAATTQSIEKRLGDLKGLYDGGLIGKEVYLDQQRSILKTDE